MKHTEIIYTNANRRNTDIKSTIYQFNNRIETSLDIV